MVRSHKAWRNFEWFLEMPDLEVESGSLQRMLKDLFAGAAGGIAQVLIGE